LNVSYALAGSATVGVDYQVSQAGQPTPMVNFPAGATSATMTVTPLTSTNIVGPQNIVMALAAGSSYSVGVPGTAMISLAGNSVALSSVQMSGGSPSFTWASGLNAAYRVFYKNNLTDPAWLVAGPDVAATGATTTWTDTNNANATQRFYVVTQVQ
jgi:hypothetical protein